MQDSEIKKILLDEAYIDESDINSAEKYINEQGGSLIEYLLAHKIITKNIFGQALAEYYGVPYADLSKYKIDFHDLTLIPETVARASQVVVFGHTKSFIKVGMVDPNNLEIKNLIGKKIGQPLKIYYITQDDLNNALEFYRGSLSQEFDKLLKQFNNDNLTREERDNIIVGITDLIFEYGQHSKASDIHIEPYRNNILVRFRIDGVMHEVLKLPKEVHELILTRIKIMAKMRTDKHRSAQDGKLRFNFGKDKIDVRVSIVPVTEGENIVMRLLSSSNRQFNLTDIGFSEDNLIKVKKSIKNPHGMILVTGPTGSGKTTTLYSVLKILNKPQIHISTIEDPVEYDIEGISQIQVNPKTGLTFAKGLRSIVRQDPDIIMVGEIRDKETAGIAINSALTGHLVLSTLHTNDAATTLPRLIDMGAEPYLISSTVNIIIAQRLVRKICTNCRVSYKFSTIETKKIKQQPHIKELLKQTNKKNLAKINFYKGTGCKICNHTGYNGRIGIFEVLEITDEIRELIIKHAASNVINDKAIELGMSSMLADGISKVLNGITTLDEVLRVIKK